MGLYEKIHLILDALITAVVPLFLWIFRTNRKKEHERIEQIVAARTMAIEKELEAHLNADSRQFNLLNIKLDEIVVTRARMHQENQMRMNEFGTISSDVKTLMQWFAEWRQSKF